ncbi:MAG: cell division protein SepF [Firmicutes bacterium]|nr:cell division protein SepF [Bacillota bacterium]
MSDFIHKFKVFLGVTEDFEESEEPEVKERPEEDVVPLRRERIRKQQPKARTKSTPQLVSLSGGQTAVQSRIFILEPRSFADVKEYVAFLKSRKSLILRLHQVDKAEAQRIVDFISGATHALEGNMRKLGETIFCFTPSSVVIEGDLEADFFDLIKSEGE